MNNEIELKLLLDGKQLNATVLNADQLVEQIKGHVVGVGERISMWGNAVTGFNQGLELARRGMELLNKPLDLAGNMEGYKVSMKVMLGDADQAQKRLDELISFAASTPFEIPGVIALGNQLQTVGKYSKETMTNLGDLASAAQKPLEQVASAYTKLASGQKGIAVDMFRDLLITTNDWVAATGKGVTKTGELKATTEEMLAAIPKILEAKHFSGMMEEQSKTMKGQLSNLSDAFGQVETELGNMAMPLVKSLTGMAIPALNGLKGNLDLIFDAIVVGGTAFIGYEIVVNGVTIAKKALSAAIRILKFDMETLKTTMASNPIGLLAVALTTAAVAAYELNKEFGNTIENQTKWNEQAQKLNESEQKRIATQIDAKKKTSDVADEYERLTAAYLKTKDGTDEHKIAEDKLHGILLEQQKLYPQLITSTYDYAGNVERMKMAANQASIDIGKLTGDLTKQQQALLSLKLAADDIALDQAATGLIDSLGFSKGASADFNVFTKLINDMRIGKQSLSELKPQIENLMDTYRRYADVSQGTDNYKYNIDKLQALSNLYSAVNKKVDDYNLKQAGKGIDATKNISPNSVTPVAPGNVDTSFADKKRKAAIDLEKEETLARNKNSYSLMDYVRLLEEKERKIQELATISDNIQNSKSTKELEAYEVEKDVAEKSIKLIDDQMKKDVEATDKYVEDGRKQRDADNENLIKRQNDLIKLNALKAEIFVKEQEQEQERYFNEQLGIATEIEIQNQLLSEEQNIALLRSLIRQTEDAEKVAALNKDLEISQRKKQMLIDEAQVIRNFVIQSIAYGQQEYDAKKSLLVQINQLANETVRKAIAAEIAKAVAKEIGWVVETVPWPFNLIAAPAAGLAIQALMEAAIPKFATGEIGIDGKPHSMGGRTINVEGGESIINKKATDRNREVLELINSGATVSYPGSNLATRAQSILSMPLPSATVNNYSNITAKFNEGFEKLGGIFKDQTDKMMQMENRITLSLSEFDNKYTDYKKSIDGVN